MAVRNRTIKQTLTAPKGITAVERELTKAGSVSRTGLATSLCRQFDFLDARGRPQVSSCLSALREMEGAGRIELPPSQLDLVSHWRPRRLEAPVPEPEGVPESAADVRGLDLVLVQPGDHDAVRTWNELIAREHPQGERRLVGRQLKYLVISDHGYLGGVSFSAAALRLEARDRWIGWNKEEQCQHADRVLNLSRFLIRPSIRCRNLASRVLGRCLRRVVEDFQARYSFEPWLLETFVDGDRHQGTCFRAANWQKIGRTKGRGRNDRHRRSLESIKDVYVYPLVSCFRERMGVPSDRGEYPRPRRADEGLGTSEWARQEFGTVELGDKRLRERLIKIAEDRWKRPNGSYLEATGGDRQAAKAYYHFIDSPRETLEPDALIATHRERTVERIMEHQVVLVAQDTTDLNFAKRHQTTGLGPIGTNQTGAKSLGLKLHSALALTEDGLPLGVLRSVCYAPKERADGEKLSVNRPIEEKKSFRWLETYRDLLEISKKTPNTRFVTVMDREADIFELLQEASPTRNRVGLIVRSMYNRCLEESEKKLFDQLKSSPNVAPVEIVIPRQRRKKAKRQEAEQQGMPCREGKLLVTFDTVTIQSKRSDLRSNGPVTLSAVYAREENPPAGAKRIEWFLLTTEEVATTQDAARIVDLYTRRWRIEEWHRILKSGCKVQEHQHQTAERLKRIIVLDAVLAWRIQLLTLLGREVPDLPCTIFFDQWEIRVLEAIERTKGKQGLEPPFTLGVAITLVAKQGGYLGRRSDRPPGCEVIWKGMLALYNLALGYQLGVKSPPPDY